VFSRLLALLYPCLDGAAYSEAPLRRRGSRPRSIYHSSINSAGHQYNLAPLHRVGDTDLIYTFLFVVCVF
jgi:hypothetical protein